MSAFIVEPETINRVVTYLMTCDSSKYLLQQLQERGFDTESDGFGQRFSTALLLLNAHAVSQRYGRGETVPKHAFSAEYASPMQVYKSLRCLIYQCSEGDVPQAPLYRFLAHDLCDHLASQIISRLPEYERASWG